jgi:acyl-CoA synthetase (AMP-forming)/AMP-acid ligase II
VYARVYFTAGELSSEVTMTAKERLSAIASQLVPSALTAKPSSGTSIDNLSIDGHSVGTLSWYNVHTLSPAFFLPRAAAIEPNAPAIYHRTANNKILRRTYQDFADRARGFAYYVKKKGYKRVGILCTNTPAFLEAIFGIGAAGAINIAINYRLKMDDIAYIFDHADADAIIVDKEFVHLLGDYCKNHPKVPIIIDTDTDAIDGPSCGPFGKAVLEGLDYDRSQGSKGWADLEAQAPDELAVNALAYTSGTTARPKVSFALF